MRRARQAYLGKQRAIYTRASMCVNVSECWSKMGEALRGSGLPCPALAMIDVAICLELHMRAEHPAKWCIVSGVIYDGGPLQCLVGAHCAGRVWHGRPRREQAWDAQVTWPERRRLLGLSLKSAKHAGWHFTKSSTIVGGAFVIKYRWSLRTVME